MDKRVVDQNWANCEQEGYVWQEGQWCPGGLTRSQKRRVQRLRNKEIEMEQASKVKKPRVWCAKKKANRNGPSANIHMAFLLPAEFRALDNQDCEDSDEEEIEELVEQLSMLSQKVVFDKPDKHRHLRALYTKGFVDGKPMTKMLVDCGAAVNLMPYTTFRKLGKGHQDFIKTDMMLKDFGGNTSKTRRH